MSGFPSSVTSSADVVARLQDATGSTSTLTITSLVRSGPRSVSLTISPPTAGETISDATVILSPQVTTSQRQVTSFGLRAFEYPAAAVLQAFPTSGLEQGGTAMHLRIADYIGPRTRDAAGLPSLPSAIADNSPVDVLFTCLSGAVEVAPFALLAPSTDASSDPNVQLFDLSVITPRSPCGVGKHTPCTMMCRSSAHCNTLGRRA